MRVILFTSFWVLILDQITKYFLKDKTFFITNFLKIDYVENTGAAFGVLKGFNLLFIAVAFLVIFLILKYYKEIKDEKAYVHLAVGFLLGSVLGNLVDRIFLGFVRDFIDFSFWPTFNVADTFSTVAVIILVFYTLIKK